MAAAFLLDANVLVALAWPDHEFHEKTGRWFERHSHLGWATCPLTQAALVRILCNPALANALTPQAALEVLGKNVQLPNHFFWADDIPLLEAIRGMERRVTGHRQITHAYLVGLAARRKARFATLDKGAAAWGIPAAVEFIG